MESHALDFALWERVLLAVLIAASAAIFARDFGARLAKVRQGRTTGRGPTGSGRGCGASSTRSSSRRR